MLQFPAEPPQEALDYLRAKGNKLSFDWRDVWADEHAHVFTVAKAMKFDLLSDMREAVDEALEKGVPLAEFKKQLIPKLIKQGWWGRQDMTDPATGEQRNVQLGSPSRLRIIYDANLRSAYAAGQWQRIERTKVSHPYLLYQLGPSREHRLDHAKLNGLCLPVDHPFWDLFFPPNGWGCKCHVRAISQQEYDRLKTKGDIITDAPEITLSDWTNKRTGDVIQIPDGIDPGWQTNPGQLRGMELQRKLSESRDQAFRENTWFKASELWSHHHGFMLSVSTALLAAYTGRALYKNVDIFQQLNAVLTKNISFSQFQRDLAGVFGRQFEPPANEADELIRLGSIVKMPPVQVLSELRAAANDAAFAGMSAEQFHSNVVPLLARRNWWMPEETLRAA